MALTKRRNDTQAPVSTGSMNLQWGTHTTGAYHSRPEAALPVARHAPMSWAQRLKRVFNIDVEICGVCGGTMKVIACVEDPLVIKKILTHLRGKALCLETAALPESTGHRRMTCSADILE